MKLIILKHAYSLLKLSDLLHQVILPYIYFVCSLFHDVLNFFILLNDDWQSRFFQNQKLLSLNILFLFLNKAINIISANILFIQSKYILLLFFIMFRHYFHEGFYLAVIKIS